MSVAQVFEQLEQNFNADAAQGLDLVFQFDIEDDKTYHLVINDGTCKMHAGETDGMQAFMAGQLSAEGDMMLATKLGELFKMG